MTEDPNGRQNGRVCLQMEEREKQLQRLKLAEQQFRLACTVHVAVTKGVQTLDVPLEWCFGNHRVSYEDFGLRADQAPLAASQLETTATFVMAAAIRDAIVALFPGARNDSDENVVAAYQISRMIRNAFSHSMLYPKWSIDKDCENNIFEIKGIISIDTNELDGKSLEWSHYGGPLAMFYFGRFVREELIKDKISSDRQKPPVPTVRSYQQGRIVLRQI